jgi:hypothetical protein
MMCPQSPAIAVHALVVAPSLPHPIGTGSRRQRLGKVAVCRVAHDTSPGVSPAVIAAYVSELPDPSPVSPNGQHRPSRGKPNRNDHPFPVQEATEQVSYPLHPAIFVA